TMASVHMQPSASFLRPSSAASSTTTLPRPRETKTAPLFSSTQVIRAAAASSLSRPLIVLLVAGSGAADLPCLSSAPIAWRAGSAFPGMRVDHVAAVVALDRGPCLGDNVGGLDLTLPESRSLSTYRLCLRPLAR